MMYGRGLNSIRWRFTLMIGAVALIGVVARGAFLGHPHVSWLESIGTLIAFVGALSGITFWMASKLTGSILSLKRSAEAIAAGDFDSPVAVDCSCEVGVLANSFRKMTSRLNANILRINTLAYTDPITALPNRSAIDHLLNYALDPAREGAFRAAIAFIDLDGFKRINDSLGHDGGDILLKLASQRILSQGLGRTPETIDACMDSFGNPCERLPEDIVFARFAGDEFVAILPGMTDHEQLSQIGESIIRSLREPFTIKGQEVTVSASVGIAIAPDHTRSAAELLTFADMAMYSSKQAGKSRFMFFDKGFREVLLERTRLEAELRQAFDRNELFLNFQPKVNARTMELSGVEALVRWQHPERGVLGPGVFIDVAEQAGMMAQLGHRVLVLAVEQCRLWLDEGIRRPVAVNVSPSQFADPGFVDSVLRTLRALSVPTDLLTIEITESMAMTDSETTARRLEVLRRAGVHISVDDFGIGFSNLSQLSRLAIDELKIDRSLIEQIGCSAKSEAIIRAIIGMTHALGYRAIAEGIENTAQLEFLRALGCDVAQGYLFGKPLSADDLETWLAQHERRYPRVVPFVTQAMAA